jgi:hypothetical protein
MDKERVAYSGILLSIAVAAILAFGWIKYSDGINEKITYFLEGNSKENPFCLSWAQCPDVKDALFASVIEHKAPPEKRGIPPTKTVIPEPTATPEPEPAVVVSEEESDPPPVIRIPEIQYGLKPLEDNSNPTRPTLAPQTSSGPPVAPQLPNVLGPTATCRQNQLDINAASFDTLRRIIHIDKERAGQIVQLREELPFASVDDLVRVKGIADDRLQAIKQEDIACVGPFSAPEIPEAPTPPTPEPDPDKYLTLIREIEVQEFTQGATGSQYGFSHVTAVYEIVQDVDQQRITVGLAAAAEASRPLWYVNMFSEDGQGEIQCIEGESIWESTIDDNEGDGGGCYGELDGLAFDEPQTIEIRPIVKVGDDGWQIFLNGTQIVEAISDGADHEQDSFLRDNEATNEYSCSKFEDRPPRADCNSTEEPPVEEEPESTEEPEEEPDATDGATGSDAVEP